MLLYCAAWLRMLIRYHPLSMYYSGDGHMFSVYQLPIGGNLNLDVSARV